MILTLLASLVLILALLGAAGVLTWVERRLLGFLQERLGPNRVGPFGFLQWVADTVKLVTKEDAPPRGADRFVFRLAPALAAVPVLAGFGVVAFGEGLSVSALDVGLLFAMGMLALFLMQLVFLAIGILLGCAMKQHKRSSAAAVSVLMVTYFFSIISGLYEKLDFLKYFSPFKYFDPKMILDESRLDPLYVGISAAIIIAALGLSYMTYSRRDLYI